jgi:4-hydroxy-4-methyl-2-oxoglutarate aldolase
MPSDQTRQRWGHFPVVRPRIGQPAGRIPVDMLERFRRVPVADTSDAVGRLYTMQSSIVPLYEPQQRMVGTALTVKAVPGDNAAVHAALGKVSEGDVLVVDWRGYAEGAAGGANMLVLPVLRGLRGVVVDGALRDVEDIRDLGIPAFGVGASCFSPSKSYVGEINVPVCCGGVVVEPGDLVIGDTDGVAVVPRRDIELVAQSLKEPAVRRSIDDYPQEQLERRLLERQEWYLELFRAANGVASES